MTESVAERLRRARAMSGLSARALSGLAGLSAPHVSLIEGGQPNLEAKTAAKIARVLGVSLDWLIAGDGDEPTPDSVLAAVATAREVVRVSLPATTDTSVERESPAPEFSSARPTGA